jgi:hypothetical protein
MRWHKVRPFRVPILDIANLVVLRIVNCTLPLELYSGSLTTCKAII